MSITGLAIIYIIIQLYHLEDYQFMKKMNTPMDLKKKLNKQQEHNLIDALKISCRKFTKEKTGKKPFTNINLVKI